MTKEETIQEMLDKCLAHNDQLEEWEKLFIATVARQWAEGPRSLDVGRLSVLMQIYMKVV